MGTTRTLFHLLTPLGLVTAAAAQTGFVASSVVTGADALTIRTGDLDEDGFPEALVAHGNGPKDALVLRNTAILSAACTFQSWTRVAPGDAIECAVADVEGSSAPDLIVLRSSGSIDVFVGPVLTPGTSLATSTAPISLLARDFDRDGDNDVLVLHANGGNTSYDTFVHNGLALQPAVTVAVGTGIPTAWTTGHFDPSSRTDLAITIHDGSGGRVELLQNVSIATPQFQSLATIPLASPFLPTGIAAADLDGNGHDDVAVTNALSPVVALAYHPGGPFTAPVPFSPATNVPIAGGAAPSAVVGADFDGNGYVDLAVSCHGSASVHALWNPGCGQLIGPNQTLLTPVTMQPVSLAVADLDGDDDPDLLAAGQGAQGANVDVFCNARTDDHCCHEMYAGIADSYGGGTETACPSAAMVALHPGPFVDFDSPAWDIRFGHTFTGLPANIRSARLVIRMQPNVSSSTDSLSLSLDGPSGFYGFGARLWELLPGGNGTLTLDLGNLPGGKNLLPMLSCQRKLDVYLQDDTQVDWMELHLTEVCPGSNPTLAFTHTPLIPGQTSQYTLTGTPSHVLAAYVFGSALGCVPLGSSGSLCVEPAHILIFDFPSGGVSTLDLPIPNSPGLLCLNLHCQGTMLAPPTLDTSCTISAYVTN
ncbi:MAG: VCBS repeat-containing protein [Planctomycetes bacterium]|nr:VCBS repeat-containing protein [Planctomycetota bacterium]